MSHLKFSNVKNSLENSRTTSLQFVLDRVVPKTLEIGHSVQYLDFDVGYFPGRQNSCQWTVLLTRSIGVLWSHSFFRCVGGLSVPALARVGFQFSTDTFGIAKQFNIFTSRRHFSLRLMGFQDFLTDGLL